MDRPKVDAVITQAEALAADLPHHPILQRIRIDAYITRGTFDTALDVVDAGIAHDPDDLDLYNTKLGLLARLNDMPALEDTLKAMLVAFPDNQPTQETYLRYLLSRDRVEDAQAFLEKLFTEATPDGRNGAFLSLINFLHQSEGDDAALARVEDELADDAADNQTWQMLRATLIFEMGRQDEAIVAMQAIVDADPTNMTVSEVLNAQTALAQMLLLNGDETAARQKIEDVLSEDAGVPNALKMRATWRISEDDTAGAINDLRLALDANPDDANAMVLMASAYERAGNKDLRQSFLARAAESSNSAPRYELMHARALMDDEKFLQAENALIKALRLVPNHVEILQTLGEVYLSLDDMPRADQVARSLAKIDTDQARAAAQPLQAELVARRLGVDEALQFLEQQAGQNDDPVTTALTLIQARLKTGRIEDALRTAQDAIAKNPDDARLRNALALSYASINDLDAAKAEFTSLLNDFPEAANIYLQLARINMVLDDFSAGAQTIDQGLAVLPDNPQLLWAKASYLEQAGDIAGAIDIYETLYERNSESLVVANNLASLLVTYRDDPESLDRAEIIARRMNGTDIPELQDTYGYIQFRRGNFSEALTYLEPAAAGLFNDPIVQFHLGEVYAALDRPDEALAQMRLALDIASPFGDEEFRAKLTAQIAALEEAAAVAK